MFGFDLLWEAYRIADRHVPRHHQVAGAEAGYTSAGVAAFTSRFNHRYRMERLRLFAAVCRGELDFMVW